MTLSQHRVIGSVALVIILFTGEHGHLLQGDRADYGSRGIAGYSGRIIDSSAYWRLYHATFQWIDFGVENSLS